MRCGLDLKPHAGFHILAPQEFGRDSKILDPGVRARAEERDVDLRPRDVLDWLEIRRIRRTCDLWAHPIDIEGERLQERRIVVVPNRFECAPSVSEVTLRP